MIVSIYFNNSLSVIKNNTFLNIYNICYAILNIEINKIIKTINLSIIDLVDIYIDLYKYIIIYI